MLTYGFLSLAVFYLCVFSSTLAGFLPSCSLAVVVQQNKVVVASNISTTSLYGNIVNGVFPVTIDQSIVYLVFDIPIWRDPCQLIDLCAQRWYLQSQDHLSTNIISQALSIPVHLASTTFSLSFPLLR